MTPSEVADTVEALRDAQHITSVCLLSWLRRPTASALERLHNAREDEARLFKIILSPDRKPGFLPGHQGYRKKLRGEEAANEA